MPTLVKIAKLLEVNVDDVGYGGVFAFVKNIIPNITKVLLEKKTKHADIIRVIQKKSNLKLLDLSYKL